MREDSELVQLAVGGDQAAFAELYERYFDNVYDFLARMVRNRDEAADLAQDTFLRAMNSLSSLAKGGSFKSWLFTIARNTALNRIERASRLQPLEQQTAEGDEVELQVIDPDRFGNPEEAAEASAYAALVWEAAASLDQRTYSVLDLSVRQNLSSEELAEVLGVTRNNAYVMVNRMKSALEGAIGSLVLLRNGRRECTELNAALDKLQISEMTPEARRIIDRHAARCETCSEQRRKLASPFAIFAGFGLAYPATGVKAAIFENVATGFSQTYGGAGAASSAAGAPTGGGVMPGVGAVLRRRFRWREWRAAADRQSARWKAPAGASGRSRSQPRVSGRCCCSAAPSSPSAPAATATTTRRRRRHVIAASATSSAIAAPQRVTERASATTTRRRNRARRSSLRQRRRSRRSRRCSRSPAPRRSRRQRTATATRRRRRSRPRRRRTAR